MSVWKNAASHEKYRLLAGMMNMTSGEAAARLGCTRNAIIGFRGRNPELNPGKLPGRKGMRSKVGQERAAKAPTPRVSTSPDVAPKKTKRKPATQRCPSRPRRSTKGSRAQANAERRRKLMQGLEARGQYEKGLLAPVPLKGAEPVPYLDATPNQCAYPLWVGDTPLREKTVCGQPIDPDASSTTTQRYCAAHGALCCPNNRSRQPRRNFVRSKFEPVR